MKTKNYMDLTRSLDGELHLSAVVRNAYATDASIYQVLPSAVVVPKTDTDIVRTVMFARANGLSITMRGAGSSTAGQAIGSGIVIDTTRYLNRIISVDSAAGLVVVQPGVVIDDLNRYLKPYGKRVGFAPSSSAYATVGGAIGNNASGARSIKYGATRDYIHSLDVILNDGTLASTKRLPAAALDDSTKNPSRMSAITNDIRSIINRYSDAIAARSIRGTKNSSGYALDHTSSEGFFDLAQLITGSEGTLAIVTGAVLRITDLPKARGTALLHFDRLANAGHAIMTLRELAPSALEIMDSNFIAMVRREHTGLSGLSENIQAALLLEFEEDDAAIVKEKLTQAESRVTRGDYAAVAMRTTTDERETAELWRLRQVIVPLLNRLRSDKVAPAFIEDISVPPERITEYIERVSAILDRHGYKNLYAVFGHAGDGNMHIRPLMNLKDGAERARAFVLTDEVHALVREIGGTLAGEHGDGRLRTPYLKEHFGELYPAFIEVKKAFDPDGIFNPGIIADASSAPVNTHLRYDDTLRKPKLKFRITDRDRDAALREAGRCNGCGECRTFCPAFKATEAELALPRAKSNLIRGMETGIMPDAGKFYNDTHTYAKLFDLCIFCQRCEKSCPAGVNAGKTVYALKEDFAKRKGVRLTDRIFANTDMISMFGKVFAPILNVMLTLPPVHALMAFFTGMHPHRSFPRFKSGRSWDYDRRYGSATSSKKVALFHGCHANAFAPEVTTMYMDLLGRSGCTVVVPKQVCCALPAMTAGMEKMVRINTRKNIASFMKYLNDGYDIVTPCPSCALMIKEQWPRYAEGSVDAKLMSAIAWRVHPIEEYLAALLPKMRAAEPMEILYFTPCHERAQASTHAKTLSAINGVRVSVIDDICCGSGGTFGMKAKNAVISDTLGEKLKERIASYKPAIVVSPCGMCRERIASVTNAYVVHPAALYRTLAKE
ncbi:MAG: FAD-binding protein [Spirochaetes bacterium]|nr:FAD-binding protein [Spirochaetota bacterium]